MKTGGRKSSNALSGDAPGYWQRFQQLGKGLASSAPTPSVSSAAKTQVSAPARTRIAKMTAATKLGQEKFAPAGNQGLSSHIYDDMGQGMQTQSSIRVKPVAQTKLQAKLPK